MRDPDCRHEPISIIGLAALARKFPRTWKRKLGACRTGRPDPKATVGELLRTGWFPELFPSPKSATIANVKKKRTVAARLVFLAGDRRVLDVTEAAVEEIERRALVEHPVGRKAFGRTRARDVGNMLRQLAMRAQIILGLDSSVVHPDQAGGIRPGRRRPPRKGIRPKLLGRIVGQAKALLEAMVVFTAGCGLLEEEALRLRSEDLSADRRVVRVRGGLVRGRPGERSDRRAFVPAWGVPILRRVFGNPEDRDPKAFLFPHRSDEARHRGTFRPELIDACKRGYVDPPVGFMGLVDLHRALCREWRVPRALGRGSHIDNLDGPEPRGYKLLRELAEAWQEPQSPPGLGDARQLRVPRKPPGYIGPDEPERTTRKQARKGRGRPAAAEPAPKTRGRKERRTPAPPVSATDMVELVDSPPVAQNFKGVDLLGQDPPGIVTPKSTRDIVLDSLVRKPK